MYILPSMSEKLGKTTISKRRLKIIRKKNRLVLITENVSGGYTSGKVVPFRNKEEEELFVLEQEKKNTKNKIKNVCLTFATRTITYCIYKGKQVELDDNTIQEAPYIFDGQSQPGNEIHIIPASKLSELVDISRFNKLFQEKVIKNPEKMCMLYYNNNIVLWLNDDYTRISELKKKHTRNLN